MRALSRVSGILLAVAFATSCGPRNGRSDAPPDGDPAAAFVARYLEELLAGAPEKGRELGLHEYDGKVPPIDAERYAAQIARAKEALETIEKLDVDTLEDPVKLDVQLVALDAERRIFQLETRQLQKKLLIHRELFDVSTYLIRDYAPLAERVSSLLDHVEAATAEVDPMLALLDPKQPRTHIETAKKVFGGMREYYEGDVKTQSEPALAKDPALRARYDHVIGAGLAGVDRIMKWIDDVGLENATDDFALGEAHFLRMLEVNEGLRATLPELEAMAKADFERNHAAFIATAKQIDANATVQAVVARVASERLPADRVLATAKQQLDQLLAFIEEKDIVTIGSTDRATVEVTPPFQRWNSAFLQMAGPFEKAKGSFYYISPPDPSWPKEMQEAYIPYEGDLLSTSTHEVYPGHFLQGLHARKSPTLARKLLESYAFVEGWAHYGEEMMFEAGLGAGDARLKLGQLSNALLRNCRFLAAIGLHTRGMTVEQANRLFQEQCFIDPGNAVQQAYRGTFDPGYFSYTLGKLQIMELRKDFFAKRKTTSFREFHDWLLSFGSPPVALIRARL